MKSLKALIAGAVGFLLFGGVTHVVASTLSQESTLAGYKFQNVRFSPTEGSPDGPGHPIDITVAYEIAWAEDAFPGLQTCTITATGRDGATLAQKSFDLYSMTREFVAIHTEVNLPSFTEKPSDVRVDCAPAPSSDPTGAWEFSNVIVQRDVNGPFGPETFRFTVDERWTGTGHPIPQKCTAHVWDSARNEILAQTFGFNDADGAKEGATFDLPGPAGEQDPSSADIHCTDVT